MDFFCLIFKEKMNYLLQKREENQRKSATKACSPGNREYRQ